MEWARILAYITGTVDQELLLRNEYLAAENRILRGQLKGQLKRAALVRKRSEVLSDLRVPKVPARHHDDATQRDDLT